MTNSQVYQWFVDQLTTYLATQSPTPTLQTVNSTVTPTGTFVRVFPLVARTAPMTVGQSPDLMTNGIVQLSVFAPKNAGYTTPAELMEGMQALFPINRYEDGDGYQLQIMGVSDQPPVEWQQYFHFNCQINWTCIKNN